jgi:hypothetical protein
MTHGDVQDRLKTSLRDSHITGKGSSRSDSTHAGERVRDDYFVHSLRGISAAALVLTGTACVAGHSISGGSSPQEDTGVVDGVYEFQAEVDVGNESGGVGETTVLTVRGTITFALGEPLALENDYSRPCRVLPFEPGGLPRTVVECPDLELAILRDHNPSVRDLTMNIGVSERSTGCAVDEPQIGGKCPARHAVVSSEKTWKRARLLVWKQTG